MSKCHGCGIILQNENREELGFTPNLESELCERCFRIRNYNDYLEIWNYIDSNPQKWVDDEYYSN